MSEAVDETSPVNETAEVRRLAADEAEAVVDVLCEAFCDYPVMRFVVGPDVGAYDAKLRTLVGFFVMARVHRGEILLGVGPAGDLTAAALVSRPEAAPSPALAELRDRMWAELGTAARDRYGVYGASVGPFQVDAPHIHLNMIGTRRRVRGRGLGGTLLRHVHGLSERDPDSTGVTLTTEDPGNVALYRRFGYRIVGEATVSPTLHTWGFFRPDGG
jgi:ribosomal protein S18 acetylase RimI-like enzyme